MGERLKVLVVDSNLAHHVEALESAVADIADVDWLPVKSPEAPSKLGDVDVLVSQYFPPEWAAAAPQLKLILAPGAGYDGVSLEAVPAGVPVANTFHHAASIAEYVLATAILMRRDLAWQDRELRDGRWASSVYKPGVPQPPTLATARVGIVGYGGIGEATWGLFRSLGASGRAVSRTPRAEPPDGLEWFAGMDRLDDLLRESDVVVVCAPLTPETEGLIGRHELELIGPEGLLINVSRGPLVEPEALYAALASGTLGAAVLDVWYSYPSGGFEARPSEQPFGELPNVFMTPHVSGVTSATFLGRADDVAANIRHLHDGEPIERVVFVGPRG